MLCSLIGSVLFMKRPLVPTPPILGTYRLMESKGVLIKYVYETTMGE